jgi:AcrR family transcriptional regulator
MPPRNPGSGRIGRPPRLSQEAIVAAAQAILDTEGPEHLSMRRLAKDLASTPMALYHYVPDKDGLLLLLLEAHAKRIPRLKLPEDPRDRLLVTANHLHTLLVDRPWIVEILASDDLMAVSAMWIVETILESAVACGLTPEQAVYVYRTIWYYTTGELLIRITRQRTHAHLDRPPHRDGAFAALDSDEFPQLRAIASRWPALTSQDTYRRGLEDLVDGLLARLAP